MKLVNRSLETPKNAIKTNLGLGLLFAISLKLIFVPYYSSNLERQRKPFCDVNKSGIECLA